MPFSRKLRLGVLLVILGCTMGCDQISKHVARDKLGEFGSITLPGELGELRLAENSGSFLSLGDSLPQQLRLVLSTALGLGMIGLLAYLVIQQKLNWLSFVGLALVCAGGSSNCIDRLTRHGHVSDFIFLRLGPLHTGIFNVADVAIMAGIAAVGCDLWLRRHDQASQKSS